VILLLDTHVFLWLASSPDRLSAEARKVCQDLENTLLLSMASIWEIQIKHQLGKLTLSSPLDQLIAEQQTVNAVILLPIELAHILRLQSLPPLHKDPFDRILVAQSIVTGATLLTADAKLPDYPAAIFRVAPTS